MQNVGEGAVWWCLIVVWVHGSCSPSSSPSLSLSPSPHHPHPNGSPFLPHEQLIAVADWGAAVVVAIIAIPPTIHPTSSDSWGWRWVVCCWPHCRCPSWLAAVLHVLGVLVLVGGGIVIVVDCTLTIHPLSRGSQAWGGCVGLSHVWSLLPVQ
ncbi:hypothetical protein L208DRAFT_1417107 [Tricholoma matsutake]|nr:hypothetical protein L208DRAFT_1417107 [Tricholoma matsutake 945]